jgi:RimJ/RimL family protein N-acetyltransferase
MAMDPVEKPPLDYVKVKTTLPVYPFPPNSERESFQTKRLTMRPMTQDDFGYVRAVRTEPEGMIWATQGRPDIELEETQKSLDRRLPPNDVKGYDWLISLTETGEFVGIGGSCVWSAELGWPAIGYQFLKAHWGKGYASEFVKGYLDHWWSLPRTEVEISVDRNTIRGDSQVQDECISAITIGDHVASQKVLKKCGMEFASSWTEPDARGIAETVTLHGFVARKEKVG